MAEMMAETGRFANNSQKIYPKRPYHSLPRGKKCDMMGKMYSQC